MKVDKGLLLGQTVALLSLRSQLQDSLHLHHFRSQRDRSSLHLVIPSFPHPSSILSLVSDSEDSLHLLQLLAVSHSERDSAASVIPWRRSVVAVEEVAKLLDSCSKYRHEKEVGSDRRRILVSLEHQQRDLAVFAYERREG